MTIWDDLEEIIKHLPYGDGWGHRKLMLAVYRGRKLEDTLEQIARYPAAESPHSDYLRRIARETVGPKELK